MSVVWSHEDRAEELLERGYERTDERNGEGLVGFIPPAPLVEPESESPVEVAGQEPESPVPVVEPEPIPVEGVEPVKPEVPAVTSSAKKPTAKKQKGR